LNSLCCKITKKERKKIDSSLFDDWEDSIIITPNSREDTMDEEEEEDE